MKGGVTMPAIKHSKQRDAIMEYLKNSHEHPTADTVYAALRKEHPNISLGTVYRNLALLAELGEINKLSTGNGPDRFDGDIHPHYHFVCKKCSCVSDLYLKGLEMVDDIAGSDFKGSIDGHVTYFFGTCEDCLKENE